MTEPSKGTGKKPPGSSRRLYTDENPRDTIPIKFSTVKETRETIDKLEKLFKSGKRPHLRISQVAQVLEQRLRFVKSKDKKRHTLAKRYTTFLKKRTQLRGDERKKISFK